MDKKFIVVEGVIGAGKTTLTNILSEYYNAETILEEVETNPFLSNFYKDRKNYAFQTQIYFLLSRYKQMLKFKQLNLFNSTIISDYLFDKDYIFAEINLDDNEFNMYKTIYNLMKTQLTTPDLVIYLQGSLETLIKHIKMRGRTFESNISPDYLKILNEKYNGFFFKYSNSPLLIINIDKVDFLKENFDFDYFIKEIETDFSGKKFLSF